MNDDYIRYQVRKYGISNTVGLWLTDKKPTSISYKDIVDAIIEMNCRDWWRDNLYDRKLDSRFMYYLKRLSQLKQAYRSGNLKQVDGLVSLEDN